MTSSEHWNISLEELGLRHLEISLESAPTSYRKGDPRNDAAVELWQFIIDRYKKGCEMAQEALVT